MKLIHHNLIPMTIQILRGILIQEMNQSNMTFEGLAQKIGLPVDEIKTLITLRSRYVHVQTLVKLASYYQLHLRTLESMMNSLLEISPLAVVRLPIFKESH